MISSTEFDILLTQLLEEYSRKTYKTINYTDTFSREFLLKFITAVQDRVMFKHCDEDRMMQEDSWDDSEMIDKMYEQEQELKHNNLERDGQ